MKATVNFFKPECKCGNVTRFYAMEMVTNEYTFSDDPTDDVPHNIEIVEFEEVPWKYTCAECDEEILVEYEEVEVAIQ